MVVNRLGTIGGALLLLASGAWCMPSGTVLIRGLRKELNGVEWEVQGDRVKVKTDRGTRWFDMADVELIPDVDSVDRGKPPRLSDEQHRKLQRRLTLAPPDGWVPQQATQPLLAEAYKHPAEQVYLELWITPAGDYEFAKEATIAYSGVMAGLLQVGVAAEVTSFDLEASIRMKAERDRAAVDAAITPEASSAAVRATRTCVAKPRPTAHESKADPLRVCRSAMRASASGSSRGSIASARPHRPRTRIRRRHRPGER